MRARTPTWGASKGRCGHFRGAADWEMCVPSRAEAHFVYVNRTGARRCPLAGLVPPRTFLIVLFIIVATTSWCTLLA